MSELALMQSASASHSANKLQAPEHAKTLNHHTVNSLKRPITTMKSHLNCKSAIILLLLALVGVMLAPRRTYCDVGFCPKNLAPIFPCSCNNGTQGLLIKCTNLNLALLSNSLKNLPDQSVEQIEIANSTVSRLFGPLIADSTTYKFHTTLRELDVRSSGLRSVEAASISNELRANIQFLMLDGNLIPQVPSDTISSFTNLKLLNLSSNLIVALDNNAFLNATNLLELDLSSNRISRLARGAFNSLQVLESLNLAGNEIAKLEKSLFSFGKKLKSLDLSNNKLSTLDRQDFNDLTSLETLRIANNLLTTVPRSIFTRNAKLYNLDLSFNKLEDIDTYLFKSVRFLKDLNMSGNLIKEITKNTFSPTTRIKRINLSQNLLQALVPETFKGLEWLEKIDLSRNQIVNISNDAFSRIFSVEIDLSHNKLTRIFYYAFHEVSNITKLDLSHNLIDDGISLIAFEQTDCAHLDLSYNQIQDISKIPISNLTGIRILDISHNQITEFNKKSFTQKFPLYELHSIDASYNNISQISGNVLERLKSIRYLNISHNSLRRLTSGGLGNSPTLLELDLSYNNLVDVVSGTLFGLVSMKNLDISYNRLKKMIPVPVALNSIHLEHNEVSQISKAAFPSLNSLLELHLDHNRVSHIEDGTFSTLSALHTLSLRYNNLSLVPATALKDLASLQLLRLDGNNIQRLGRKAFGTLPIVFDLYLDHNNISSIANHAFEGMLQLLTLNLSHNNLLELPPEAFSGLVSLRNLDLSNNQLNRFENKSRSAMEDMLSLEVANLSNNKLSMITAKTFLSSPYIPYKLTHLDLSNNLIGVIVNNFANGLKKVQWLSLRNNIINEIFPNVIGNATHLQYLDLSHNKLRSFKDRTFDGRLVNLTTLLLNNNKLNSIQPQEFDRLKSLSNLDLSANRIETFYLNYTVWIRRGIRLDLRMNNLECGCDLLPFVAWIDGIKAMSRSLNLLQSGSVSSSYRPTSNIMSQPQLERYLQSALLVNNITCSKPESMNAKSLMSMIDLVYTDELNCDQRLLDEAEAWRRLRAPIHFTGAEPYYYSGEQHLKIGWNLMDPNLDLESYLIIRSKFVKPFALSLFRWQRQSAPIDIAETYPILEHDIERVLYSQRTHVWRNLEPSGFHVICISYETGVESGGLPHNVIDLFKSSVSNATQRLFMSFLVDYSRWNCVDIQSLMQQDNSERLVSSASRLPTDWTKNNFILIQMSLIAIGYLYYSALQVN